MNRLFNQLRDLLGSHFLIPPASVQLRKSFSYDFGMSSLEFMEMIVCLEDQLDIQIPDYELFRIHKVQDLLHCIHKLDNMEKPTIALLS